MTAQAIETEAGIRIIQIGVIRSIARRLERPVPAVIGTLLVLYHDGPGAQLRALFGGRREHFLHDDRAIGDFALAVPVLEPVPGLRRVKNLHRIVSAERGAVEERSR